MLAEEIVSTALLFLGIVLGPAIFLLSIVGYCVTRAIAHIQKQKERRYVRSLPCSHCRYFAHGELLKCAVNPQQVLTDEAHDCSDFACENDQLIAVFDVAKSSVKQAAKQPAA